MAGYQDEFDCKKTILSPSKYRLWHRSVSLTQANIKNVFGSLKCSFYGDARPPTLKIAKPRKVWSELWQVSKNGIVRSRTYV